MTRRTKLWAILLVVALIGSLVAVVAACDKDTTPTPDPSEHVCQHKCLSCGLCTDLTCEDPKCEQKCPYGGEHFEELDGMEGFVFTSVDGDELTFDGKGKAFLDGHEGTYTVTYAQGILGPYAIGFTVNFGGGDIYIALPDVWSDPIEAVIEIDGHEYVFEGKKPLEGVVITDIWELDGIWTNEDGWTVVIAVYADISDGDAAFTNGIDYAEVSLNDDNTALVGMGGDLYAIIYTADGSIAVNGVEYDHKEDLPVTPDYDSFEGTWKKGDGDTVLEFNYWDDTTSLSDATIAKYDVIGDYLVIIDEDGNYYVLAIDYFGDLAGYYNGSAWNYVYFEKQGGSGSEDAIDISDVAGVWSNGQHEVVISSKVTDSDEYDASIIIDGVVFIQLEYNAGHTSLSGYDTLGHDMDFDYVSITLNEGTLTVAYDGWDAPASFTAKDALSNHVPDFNGKWAEEADSLEIKIAIYGGQYSEADFGRNTVIVIADKYLVISYRGGVAILSKVGTELHGVMIADDESSEYKLYSILEGQVFTGTIYYDETTLTFSSGRVLVQNSYDNDKYDYELDGNILKIIYSEEYEEYDYVELNLENHTFVQLDMMWNIVYYSEDGDDLTFDGKGNAYLDDHEGTYQLGYTGFTLNIGGNTYNIDFEFDGYDYNMHVINVRIEIEGKKYVFGNPPAEDAVLLSEFIGKELGFESKDIAETGNKLVPYSYLGSAGSVYKAELIQGSFYIQLKIYYVTSGGASSSSALTLRTLGTSTGITSTSEVAGEFSLSAQETLTSVTLGKDDEKGLYIIFNLKDGDPITWYEVVYAPDEQPEGELFEGEYTFSGFETIVFKSFQLDTTQQTDKVYITYSIGGVEKTEKFSLDQVEGFPTNSSGEAIYIYSFEIGNDYLVSFKLAVYSDHVWLGSTSEALAKFGGDSEEPDVCPWEEYIGSYASADGKYVVVISETTVTITVKGEEHELVLYEEDGYYDSTFSGTWNGKMCYVSAYSDQVSLMIVGVISGLEYLPYCEGEIPPYSGDNCGHDGCNCDTCPGDGCNCDSSSGGDQGNEDEDTENMTVADFAGTWRGSLTLGSDTYNYFKITASGEIYIHDEYFSEGSSEVKLTITLADPVNGKLVVTTKVDGTPITITFNGNGTITVTSGADIIEIFTKS